MEVTTEKAKATEKIEFRVLEPVDGQDVLQVLMLANGLGLLTLDRALVIMETLTSDRPMWVFKGHNHCALMLVDEADKTSKCLFQVVRNG